MHIFRLADSHELATLNLFKVTLISGHNCCWLNIWYEYIILLIIVTEKLPSLFTHENKFFQSCQHLHNPGHNTIAIAQAHRWHNTYLSSSASPTKKKTKKIRVSEATSAFLFGERVRLLLAFDLFRAFREACTCSGFTPVCKKKKNRKLVPKIGSKIYPPKHVTK